MQYDNLPAGTKFDDGKGARMPVEGDLDITAILVTEDDMKPGISVEGASISPDFHSRTRNYTATVSNSVSSVKIAASVNERLNATITGTGEKELKEGNNTFKVNLKIPLFEGSELGYNMEYTITLTREGKVSDPGQANGSSGQTSSSSGQTNGSSEQTSGSSGASAADTASKVYDEVPDTGEDTNALCVVLFCFATVLMSTAALLQYRKRRAEY